MCSIFTPKVESPAPSRRRRNLAGKALPLLLIAIVTLAGCTEEKAKALRLAAEIFRVEADAACDMGAASLKQAVAMPARTRSEIARNLAEPGKFGAAELEVLSADGDIVDAGIKPAIDALGQVCAAHRQLAAIYTDLPRGYLLATEDVVRAQQHVVNVTVRFARLAAIFDGLPNVGRDNVARIRIIEARARAMAVADVAARAPLLDALAGEILDNQRREAAARAQVLAQFARATDFGEQLVNISVNYDKLSVADILDSLQEFSVLYGSVTGRTGVAQNAVDRIKKVEARISGDPLLKPLLDAEISR